MNVPRGRSRAIEGKAMRSQYSLRYLLLVVVSVACTLASFQAGYRTGYSARSEMLHEQECVLRIYSVPDLHNHDAEPINENRKGYLRWSDDLFTLGNGLIRDTINPAGWVEVGGDGDLAALPSKSALVVWQSYATHEEIGEFLRLLRGEIQELNVRW